ncbi:hypothetical protein F5Y06DRAFT_9984 [Hypoxylon sp. FL0890]|nr:hypothetical protein F5Y06DRAFT_9984 [Hypoxylon sp. FL0890]
MRINRTSQAVAYRTARRRAWEVGNPVPFALATTYRRRTIRVPRSPLSVAIQLPDAPVPVAPDEPIRLGLGQRKRPFSRLQPSYNQFHAPASDLSNPQSTPATPPVAQEC